MSIVIISLLMHLPHFNKELMSIHVWRQTQTQSTINNFYEEDMNILNPRRNDRRASDGIFRMEFPLMQWLVACLYTAFGKHLMISRIFMFVTGLLTTFGLYKLLQTLFKKDLLSLFGAWAFTFSPSFYYYTINPLPDNLALCFSIWGLVIFFSFTQTIKQKHLLLSGLLLSLGALCKLPFIIYFIAPITYFLYQIKNKSASKKPVLHATIILSFVMLPAAWYAAVIGSWDGNPIILGVLENKVSIPTLVNYYVHNLSSTLPELLLNYGSVPFFILGFYFLFKQRRNQGIKFKILLVLSLITLLYYIFEANAIGTIHDYYLFPFYPLLFIMVAFGSYQLFNIPKKWTKISTLFLLCLLPFTCYLRMKVRWNPNKPGFNPDLLVHKQALQNAVPKDALVIAGNDLSHFIFFYYINKKGWGFHDNELSEEQLQTMIDDGAEYLYTDSENLIHNPNLKNFFTERVLKTGTIEVYKLNN